MIPECPLSGDSRSRSRLHHNHAAGPSRSVSGLLSEIQTAIHNEPFADHYTVIPGRELGSFSYMSLDVNAVIDYWITFLLLVHTAHLSFILHAIYLHTYAAGGEIFNQCVSDQEDEAFSEEDVKRLMRQILEGVAFLHQNNVVHLDLKPQNILLTSTSPLGDIKIVDFGLSRMVSSHQELREIMGTPEYVAPEILNYEPISTATDMWSVGVLAYVMLTGISPFLGEDKQETFLNISQLSVSYSDEELQQLDPAALSFIQMLLRKHPQERATAEHCLTHPWLQPTEPQGNQTVEEILSVEEEPSSTSTEEEDAGEVHGPLTEELIVMAAYTLGQCRQSSASSVEEAALTAEQKAISKRFKFEEPFSALQEVPGEFIY
uniref:Serine/threonine kinase 17a n=1 Tax=Haplochromis burtoni TaxID=8153 RepID=A0A3Q3CML4_HAPBU